MEHSIATLASCGVHQDSLIYLSQIECCFCSHTFNIFYISIFIGVYSPFHFISLYLPFFHSFIFLTSFFNFLLFNSLSSNSSSSFFFLFFLLSFLSFYFFFSVYVCSPLFFHSAEDASYPHSHSLSAHTPLLHYNILLITFFSPSSHASLFMLL